MINPNKSPIYNHIGKHILAECKANRVSYKYACVNKIRRLQSFSEQWAEHDIGEGLQKSLYGNCPI